MKKIICFHLLNDYSGSPMVLKTVLQGLLKRGFEVTLYTSDGGVLDELVGEPHFRKVSCAYHFTRNHFATSLRIIRAELRMALHALRYFGRKDCVFYINTILPFLPAAVGRLLGRRVIYHYHENAYAKGLHYRCLYAWMKLFASEIICVSDWQCAHLRRYHGVNIVYNALSKQSPDESTASEIIQTAFHRKQVLMVSTLKRYKGVNEFTRLASEMPDYDFVLVISDNEEHIGNFVKQERLVVPSNLKIYPLQKDLTSFYREASVCLNLSNRKLFIESFGMTIIEAMSFGVPVIIPTEGGLSNFVVDGWNGYKTNSDSLGKIKQQIEHLLDDWLLYEQLSLHAISTANRFTPERQVNAIAQIINH